MAIAVSWVEYDSSNPSLEKTPFKHDLPFLDLGTYHVNSWSNANNLTDVRKFVIGLRIQGTSANNIKIWMDGNRFDSYLQNNREPQIKQNHQNRNYIFKVTDLDDVTMGWFQSCRTATTANLTSTYVNGTSGVGATLTATSNGAIGTIGGISLVLNDRILIKNQSSAFQNGIYFVTAVGDGSHPWILTRVLDLNQSDEIAPTMRVVVTYDGSTDEYYGMHLIAASPYVIGTTAIYWVKQPRISVRLNDCEAATNGELIGGFSAGTFTAAPLVIDGVNLDLYDRVLIKDQATASQNGVYYVNSLGTGANGVWIRVPEFESTSELVNQLSLKIINGSTNINKLFLINLGTNIPPFTINTTVFTWTEYIPLTIYGNHAQTWNDLGMTYDGAMNIDSAHITKNKDSFSHRVGLAMYVPSGEVNQNLRNIHLLVEFDTTDE